MKIPLSFREGSSKIWVTAWHPHSLWRAKKKATTPHSKPAGIWPGENLKDAILLPQWVSSNHRSQGEPGRKLCPSPMNHSDHTGWGDPGKKVYSSKHTRSQWHPHRQRKAKKDAITNSCEPAAMRTGESTTLPTTPKLLAVSEGLYCLIDVASL